MASNNTATDEVIYVEERIPFNAFAGLLEQLSKIDASSAAHSNRLVGKTEEKKQLLQKFMDDWRKLAAKLTNENQNHQPSPFRIDSNFFPVMRLLLPSIDRRVYNLKETRLAKYLIEALCISEKSDDAQKLLNYRAPNNVKADGDFASTAYFVLRTRCLENTKLSIRAVNHHLDVISANNARGKDGQKEVNASIKHLLVNLSALQLKWLIRILLKDLKISTKEQIVFSAFHEDAINLYNCTSSLEKVCEMLADPTKRMHEVAISLFSPCRPMLGDKAKPNKIQELLKNREFYIETKFDGERFQLHKDGDKYVYYSRNGHDYTSTFGADIYSNGSLTPYIHSAFAGAKSVILDGEMCGFNLVGNIIMSKSDEFDVKSTRVHENIQTCFCVFDILYLNGQVLTNKPLKERVDVYMKKAFKEIDGRLIYSQRELASTNKQVIDALNQAIDSRLEGIVIKDPESVYKPSVRSGSGWYKVKPDYMLGLNDDLDLLIVGGYYGSGKRAGLISHFLLAVAKEDDNDENAAEAATAAAAAVGNDDDDELDLGENEEEKNAPESKNNKKKPPVELRKEPKIFYSFCKIGSGYTMKELADLNAKLAKKWTKYDAKAANTPKHLQLTYEKPDVWIEPKESFIVQVKAVEIVPSDRYKAGMSLRFPRLERFRPDKKWHECMRLSELNELNRKNEGKLASGKHLNSNNDNFDDDVDADGGGGDDVPTIKRRRMLVKSSLNKLTVDARFRGIDASMVDKDKEHLIFDGKEFCVITGDDKHTKSELETFIAKYGGEVVQSPGKETFCVLTSKLIHKANIYVKQNLYDVIKVEWLLRCIKEKKLLDYKRTDVFHATPSLAKHLNRFYDKYGDSYLDDCTVEELKAIFSKMPSFYDAETATREDLLETREKIAFLENKYFPDDSFEYGLFRQVNAYMDIYVDLNLTKKRSRQQQSMMMPIKHSRLDLIAIKFRMHGGLVMNELDAAETTHCVLDESDQSRLNAMKQINQGRERKLHIVRSDWVLKCISSQRLVNELEFHL